MPGISIISHPKHDVMWRRKRLEGYPIISSWIDDPEVYKKEYQHNWLTIERELEICSCVLIYSSCDDLPFRSLVDIGMAAGLHKVMYCLGTFKGIKYINNHPQFIFREFPAWDVTRTLNEAKQWDATGLADEIRSTHIGTPTHTT